MEVRLFYFELLSSCQVIMYYIYNSVTRFVRPWHMRIVRDVDTILYIFMLRFDGVLLYLSNIIYMVILNWRIN